MSISGWRGGWTDERLGFGEVIGRGKGYAYGWIGVWEDGCLMLGGRTSLALSVARLTGTIAILKTNQNRLKKNTWPAV